jgi:hypothetical protein
MTTPPPIRFRKQPLVVRLKARALVEDYTYEDDPVVEDLTDYDYLAAQLVEMGFGDPK